MPKQILLIISVFCFLCSYAGLGQGTTNKVRPAPIDWTVEAASVPFAGSSSSITTDTGKAEAFFRIELEQ